MSAHEAEGRSNASTSKRKRELINELDSDEEETGSQLPQSQPERRHVENLIFKEWARKRAQEATRDDVKQQLKSVNEEASSIKEILAKQSISQKITNPRDYQIQLFEIAKKQNTIAVLGTGSGKTHIATLLLRWTLDIELENRAAGKTPKTAFFVVDSVQLVFQQTNVLQCDLDQSVEGICGEIGCRLWSKEQWHKHLRNNMVIVCTADVLEQCLMHSFVRIDLISLLVFDEAHHAKENHPYARIMREYYEVAVDSVELPRIFGMTASPVDTKSDIKQAATLLERRLHSKIATTSDLALLRNHIVKPEERVLTYEPSRPAVITFSEGMKATYNELPAITKLFEDSKKMSQELGRWCAEAFWSFAFSEEAARKVETREIRKANIDDSPSSIARLDDQISRYKAAAREVQAYDYGTPSLSLDDLSDKVIQLYKYLHSYYLKPSDARCIIFVERRDTARLLHVLLRKIGGQNLRCGLLTGNNKSGWGGGFNITTRQLVLTLTKFRKGELNCLIATSIGEEGLDIPKCNLVIRFDLYKTMIQYVQSKGRARHRNSVYLHMIEKGNFAHRYACEEAMKSEKTMRDFCNNLPSDRLIDIEANEERWKEDDFPTYIEKSTGAKLTYFSSLVVLEHFVTTLPQDGSTDNVASYFVFQKDKKFICEIIFPERSPIRSIAGRPEAQKIIAKRSAAFRACLCLRKEKYLDENFLPIFSKKLPAMRNAHLAVDMDRKESYESKLKPALWSLGRGERPNSLFVTSLDFSNGLERPHQKIALLTRRRLPQMPSFPLWLNNGQVTNVVSKSFNARLEILPETLSKLTTFTLRIFKHLFHKTYENADEKMSYWLAPCAELPNEPSADIANLSALLDWNAINLISSEEYQEWTPDMKIDFLKDVFLVDPRTGARRFYSLGVAAGLSAMDKSINSKAKLSETILEFTAGLGHKNKARWLKEGNASQPVLKAEIVPFRRDFLASKSQADDEKLRKEQIEYFVCPEPLGVSTISPRVVASFYMFPSIIHRFESYLIALEACDMLQLNIGPSLALEALTKDSENTEDAQAEQINLKRGMGPNYERMEFLGDCFLKMATSISVFIQNPDDNEFEFHVRRMLMLCNKNLFKNALHLKVYEYIRTTAFSRRNWYPEGIELLEGRGAAKKGEGETDIKHSLGDKSIADVCEALIGASFFQHNDPLLFKSNAWDEAVKAVSIFVRSDDHKMSTWADYSKSYIHPKYQTSPANASQRDLADKIFEDLGYPFRWPRLLRSAFVHPDQAYMMEGVPNYQRLEFLGDALLDMVFVSYIFYLFPHKDPQWLTEHKMPMVSNKFLGALCVKLNFHKHLRYSSSALRGAIHEYVNETEEAERQSEGARDYWMSLTDPPKCLADVVEAYVGAIFIDSDFDFTVVQQFFDKHVMWFFEDITLYDSFANNHPAVRMQKLLDDYFCCREYSIRALDTDSYLPGGKAIVTAMVMIHMKVIADATGSSRRYSKIRAIENALGKIDGLSISQFRKQFACDCPIDGDGE